MWLSTQPCSVSTCVFSPSRKADATRCRRNVPKSRPFLYSSRGHSSHSFRNRRYLVAAISGRIVLIALGNCLGSLTFIAFRSCVAPKCFRLLLRSSLPLVVTCALAKWADQPAKKARPVWWSGSVRHVGLLQTETTSGGELLWIKWMCETGGLFWR